MVDPTWAAPLLATAWAATLIPLTLRLAPTLAQIAALIRQFLDGQATPLAAYDFEVRLDGLLRQLGREIVAWTYNQLEPDDPAAAPRQLPFAGDWYRRRAKTANRHVATLFGTITLWRYLYQPLHGVEPAVFPLELRLGIVARHATAALAERVAAAAAAEPQAAVLEHLRRRHGVSWSVATLRAVTAATAAELAPHHQRACAGRLLGWLAQAAATPGPHAPVLSVGRDGVFVPIRGQDQYREAATATVSVADGAGRRLGTIYLGRMPQSGQDSLSDQLTALLVATLRAWAGPLPRLAYVTDAGHHPTTYYETVLKPMEHPRRPGERLGWEWVLDYYHVCGYISKMAAELFGTTGEGWAWARKMRRWLKRKPHGAYRVLHSAAALRSRRGVRGSGRRFQAAYDYLAARLEHLDYRRCQQVGLPLGSGVTEAGCKTVFAQRLKQAGMTWGIAGGQVIVDLRVLRLSGVWAEVYRSALQAKGWPHHGTHWGSTRKEAGNAA